MLANLGLIASFSIYMLTTSSGKHREDSSHAHFASLMSKFLISAKGSIDLSIGFDRDPNRGQQELTNNKNIKSKYHVSIMLKDIFGFSAHQLKATSGLVYRLILTRKSDKVVLIKDKAIHIGKIKINAIDWCVPHFTPSISQQTILSNQDLVKTPTEFQCVERFVFMKEFNTQNVWNFEYCTQEGIKIPTWIIIGSQQRDRQDSQNLSNDTFYRPPVTSAQCITGTEKILNLLFY